MRGLYAITGGLGGLGLRAAALLVAGGVFDVVLASRSGQVAREGQGLEVQLRSMGVAATLVACNSADPRDTEGLRDNESPAGVLHAAGASDRFIAS